MRQRLLSVPGIDILPKNQKKDEKKIEAKIILIVRCNEKRGKTNILVVKFESF